MTTKEREKLGKRLTEVVLLFMLVLGIILMCSGCISHSDGRIVSTTCLGVKIGTDADKIPTLYVGLITTDIASTAKGKEIKFKRVIGGDSQGGVNADADGYKEFSITEIKK
jgi:hypothetical protein